MANSYIIQGTNVVCTNMQVPGPLKVGVSTTNTNIVHTNKAQYFLNIEDRKISESFKCKMAAKKWGGLALLCAGLAIGGAILLTVATGGLAAPALIALAATVTTAGVAVAATGAVVAIGIGIYKEVHDCDVTLSTQWERFHDSVKFQGQNALLNSSIMNCPQGGVVTLIVDPVIAQQTAEFISNNNRKEILAQGLSKLGVGIIGGLTGGANGLGVSLAIGFDILFEDGESERFDLAKETKESGIETGSGLLIDGGQEINDIRKLTAHNQGVQRNITQFSTEAAQARAAGDASRAWSRELAAEMEASAFKDFDPSGLKNIGIGLGGAVAGFVLEQAVNQYEDNLYRDSIKMLSNSEIADSKNNIGVIATER